MELQRHAHSRRHHPIEQVHVRKHPLVPGGGDPEVPLEQRMEAVQEGLEATKRQTTATTVRRQRQCFLQ